MRLLSITDLSIDRSGKRVLDCVDLEIGQGEQWAIFGASGSGKTSLASAIAGKAYCRGRIEWSQSAEARNGAHPAALVEQDSRLALQAGRPFGEAAYYQQRYNASDSDEGLSLGEILGPALSPWVELFQLGPLLGRPVIQLSNGERRRAQIAKALSGRPLLLILDDPFSGLDASGRAALTVALRGLCLDGTQLLLFLSRGEAPDFVTHVAELRLGSLSPALPRSAFASEREAPASASASAGPSASASAPPIPDRLRHLEGAASFGTAVRLVDAVVRYGDKLALDRVSWEVRRGERWQLAGPNGAGKTTLLSLITADHPQAYANELYLFDRRRGSGETIWDIKSRIGFVSPELHAAFPRNASCEAVVASGLFDSIGLFDEPTAAQRERVSWWLEAIGEGESRGLPIDELPLGRARMLLLARALVKDPPLLILDEPCQGLDGRQASLFLALLDEICEGSATTMIFVSHVEQDIPRCVTRCLRLEAGRVAYLGVRQAPRA